MHKTNIKLNTRLFHISGQRNCMCLTSCTGFKLLTTTILKQQYLFFYLMSNSCNYQRASSAYLISKMYFYFHIVVFFICNRLNCLENANISFLIYRSAPLRFQNNVQIICHIYVMLLAKWLNKRNVNFRKS